MGRRATYLELEDRTVTILGEPIHDKGEDELLIMHDDGTFRIFNWAYVVSFYHMTEEETEYWINDKDED